LSRSCSSRLAPRITVETCGVRRHHSSAICVTDNPASAASALSARTFSILALPAGLSNFFFSHS
jgi:hypothetical protein